MCYKIDYNGELYLVDENNPLSSPAGEFKLVEGKIVFTPNGPAKVYESDWKTTAEILAEGEECTVEAGQLIVPD